MISTKTKTDMTIDNLALKKSKQSSFSKAVKTIQQNLKKKEAEALSENGVKPCVKGKSNTKRVAKPTDRGVVYLRHIPHGFYEKPMREYFSQFGQVTGVKLVRSQKTGGSRGFAFVEFLHTEVAKVVAETMNNYLMFDRLIKAEYVPPEKQKRIVFSRGLNSKIVTDANCTRAKNRAKLVRYRNKATVDPAKEVKDRRKVLKRLSTLEEKLKKEGISFHFEPVDVPPVKIPESSGDEDIIPVLHLDLSDPEIEFKCPAGTIIKPIEIVALKKGANKKVTPVPVVKVDTNVGSILRVTQVQSVKPTKQEEAKTAFELYKRQMAKAKFGSSKGPGKVGTVRANESTANGKSFQSTQNKSGMTAPKATAPKVIARKRMLKHGGIKLTPRKTPKM